MNSNHYLIIFRPPRPTFAQDATEKESAVIAEHFEYLKRLLSEGILLLAGRSEDAVMGIAVLQASDTEAADKIMRDDPAVREGIFSATLSPFRLALFAGSEA